MRSSRTPSPLSAFRFLPLCALALAGCVSLPDKPMHVQAFDLGPAPAAAMNANQASGSVVILGPMQAPADLDALPMRYRLLYAGDEQQPRPYMQARWAMTPPQLVQQRLRDALATQHTVVDTAAPGLPGRHVQAELTEFDQAFTTPEASEGVVSLRVTVMTAGAPGAGATVTQRLFTVRSPAPSANAEGGAQALRTATDKVVQQVVQWLNALPQPATR